jgi:hypothetical protein
VPGGSHPRLAGRRPSPRGPWSWSRRSGPRGRGFPVSRRQRTATVMTFVMHVESGCLGKNGVHGEFLRRRASEDVAIGDILLHVLPDSPGATIPGTGRRPGQPVLRARGSNESRASGPTLPPSSSLPRLDLVFIIPGAARRHKGTYWNCRAFGGGKRRGRCPYEPLGLDPPSDDFWSVLQRRDAPSHRRRKSKGQGQGQGQGASGLTEEVSS